MHYVILPTAVITFLLFFGILDFTGKKFDKLAEKHHREDVNNYLFQMDYKACKNLDPSIKKSDVLKMRERTQIWSRIWDDDYTILYFLVSTDGGKYWHNISYEIQDKFSDKYDNYSITIPARYFLESSNNGQKIKVKAVCHNHTPFSNKKEQDRRKFFITRYGEELSRAENCKKNNEIFYIHDYFKYPYDLHEYFSTDKFWEREFNKPNEQKFQTEYYINLLKKCIKLNKIRLKELEEELTIYKDINDEERVHPLTYFDKRYKFFDIPIYDIINLKYDHFIVTGVNGKFDKNGIHTYFEPESAFAKITQKDGVLFMEKSWLSSSIDQGYTDYKYYKDFFDSDEKEIIENLRKKIDEDKKTAAVYEAKYKFYKEEIHLPKPFRNINPDFSEDKYNNASIYKYYENEMPFIKNLLVKTQDLDNSKRSRDFWWEVVIVFCNILDFFGYYS